MRWDKGVALPPARADRRLLPVPGDRHRAPRAPPARPARSEIGTPSRDFHGLKHQIAGLEDSSWRPDRARRDERVGRAGAADSAQTERESHQRTPAPWRQASGPPAVMTLELSSVAPLRLDQIRHLAHGIDGTVPRGNPARRNREPVLARRRDVGKGPEGLGLQKEVRPDRLEAPGIGETASSELAQALGLTRSAKYREDLALRVDCEIERCVAPESYSWAPRAFGPSPR